jgi:hypothetical protein
MNVAVVLQGAATLAWLGALVIIGVAVMRAARGQTFKGAGVYVVAAVVLALVLTSVHPTYRSRCCHLCVG